MTYLAFRVFSCVFSYNFFSPTAARCSVTAERLLMHVSQLAASQLNASGRFQFFSGTINKTAAVIRYVQMSTAVSGNRFYGNANLTKGKERSSRTKSGNEAELEHSATCRLKRPVRVTGTESAGWNCNSRVCTSDCCVY